MPSCERVTHRGADGGRIVVARTKSKKTLVRPDIDAIAPYQPGKRVSEMRRETGVASMIKLSSNESPLPPFDGAIAAIKAVATAVNRYPDSYSSVLRERLVEHLGVPADQLVIGNGSNELISLIAQAILEPGDEVLTCWPSFVVYPIAAQAMGAATIKVPLTADWRFDLAAMAEAVTERTKLIFVCNPNNPTGTAVRAEEIESFMAAVPQDCLVVFDEAYFEYVDDGEFGSGMTHFDGQRPVAVLRTFSKIYALAGLRIGYGALPAWLAAAVEKLREPFNVNVAAQAAAYHSLADPAEVALRKELAARGKALVYATCEDIGLRYAPSQSNFVAFEVGDGQEFFKELVKRGVIVRAFGPSTMLRATVGTDRETTQLCQALRDVIDERPELGGTDG